jgi:hypothetical protein
VEVWSPVGRVRTHVLFVVDGARRLVTSAGISSGPDGKWMAQMARDLRDGFDGFLRESRGLIHDRDPLFTEHFSEILKVTTSRP